jgi:pimeloyl-ACP methyl ester carboxylesterase
MSKTIMLVHGAYVTPDCWAEFRGFYEDRGHTVVVPAWPYFDRPVAELQRSPDPGIAALTIKDLVDRYDTLIRALPEPPILIGHSFGGLIVQMLLDRGLGAAGVAIDAGPPRGVLPSLRAIRSALPVLLAWRGWSRILTMSLKSFSTTFANTLPATGMKATYERYIVPVPGRIFFQAALGLGNGVTFKSPKRPPLLLIAAAEDRTSTSSMVRAMYKKHSKARSRTDFVEFPHFSHWLIAEPGWQEVADKAIKWAEANATPRTAP